MLVSLWTALALVCLCRGNLSSQPTPGLNQTCNSHPLLHNRRLNLSKLKSDGAPTRRVDALTADECVQKCCSSSANAGAEHPCGLAEFNSRLTNQKCLLVHCLSCEQPAVIDGDEHIKTFAVTSPTNTTDDHHRIKDSTPKIERTIVPRKGVDQAAATKVEIAESDLAVTSEPTSTVHQADEPDDTTATPDPAASVRTDATTLPTEPATTEDTSSEYETSSGRPAVTPDTDADKHAHIVPRKGVFGDSFAPRDHHPVNNSLSDKQFEFAMLGKPHSEYHEENLSNKNATESVMPVKSETPPGVGVVKSPPIGGAGKAATNGTAEQTRPAHWSNRLSNQTATTNKNDSGRIEPIHGSGTTTTPSTAETNVSSVVLPTTNDLYLNDQESDELSVQQSVYLIASLLIGFVVLLTVIGLVMRHVHGVWERRHYHRMDFLIDGMYNNM